MLWCSLVGHKVGPFGPVGTPEWRIIGNYASLIDVYRCQRCGKGI